MSLNWNHRTSDFNTEITSTLLSIVYTVFMLCLENGLSCDSIIISIYFSDILVRKRYNVNGVRLILGVGFLCFVLASENYFRSNAGIKRT